MKRKEIAIVVKSESTPSNKNILQLISKKFSKPEETIAVKRIKGKFGENDFLINANIYHSSEAKEKTEPKIKEKKAKA